MIIQFLLQVILFLAAVIFCFYIPGKVAASYIKTKVTSLESYFFSTIYGLLLFTFFCYMFDSLHVLYIMYLFPVVCLVLFVRKKMTENIFIPSNDRKPLLLIVVLAVIFSYPMIFSGWYPNGVHLVGVNVGDGSFHLSLINELQQHFPPYHPGYAGQILQGYHFFADYVWAKVIQLFHIDSLLLYFQCIPLFVALSWGVGVYVLINRWIQSTAASLWAVFLTQYGGSFVFFIWLFGHTTVNPDSGFGMLQPFVSLANPSYSISIVIMIFTLFSLYQYLHSKKLSWSIPIILSFGLAVEFKVYAGIILLGGFILLTLYKLLRKQFSFLTFLFCMFFLVLITYERFSGEGGFLLWFPYWAPIKTARDNLTFLNYDNQMSTYGQYHLYQRIIWLQLKIFIMFTIGNLGTRCFGLLALYFYHQKKKLFFSEFTVVVLVMTGISFFIPLFFIQSIKVFEITQMFNYFLFFAALFASIGFMAFFSLGFSKIVKTIIFIAIMLLTLPSVVWILYVYDPFIYTKISNAQLQTIEQLRNKGSYNATVLIMPNSREIPNNDSWLPEIPMVVPALANKSAFLGNENISDPPDLQQRIDFVSQLVTIENTAVSNDEKVTVKELSNKLHRYHISFIYSPYTLPYTKALKIQQIYANKDSYLYKVL